MSRTIALGEFRSRIKGLQYIDVDGIDKIEISDNPIKKYKEETGFDIGEFLPTTNYSSDERSFMGGDLIITWSAYITAYQNSIDLPEFEVLGVHGDLSIEDIDFNDPDSEDLMMYDVSIDTATSNWEILHDRSDDYGEHGEHLPTRIELDFSTKKIVVYFS